MESYKELMNRAARNDKVLRVLTEDESAALKKCILGIFLKVSGLCEREGLVFMLSGGSCLGAVRHHGFIPWDDDLDMMMPRPDYQKLLALLEQGVLGPDYSFRYPGGKSDSPSLFLKVYRNDTVMMGLGGENSPYPQKVFLDVFPLDGYSSLSWKRKVKGFFANGLRLTANMVSESRPMSDHEESFYRQDPDLWGMVRKRRFLGWILSLIPHRTWVRWFDRLVWNEDLSGLVGIPTGRKLYNGEVFPSRVYMKTVPKTFEGHEVPIPSGWDEYLSNLYRNYMELPPEDKRERHFFVELEIH